MERYAMKRSIFCDISTPYKLAPVMRYTGFGIITTLTFRTE